MMMVCMTQMQGITETGAVKDLKLGQKALPKHDIHKKNPKKNRTITAGENRGTPGEVLSK